MGYVEEIEWHLRASRKAQEREAKKKRAEYERKLKADYEALMKRLDEQKKGNHNGNLHKQTESSPTRI